MNFASTKLALQVRALRQSIEFLGEGNLNAEMQVPCEGELREIRERFNHTLSNLRSLRAGIRWLSDEAGVRGQLGGTVPVSNAQGEWRGIADDVSILAGNVTAFVRNANWALGNLKRGEGTRRMTQGAHGEFEDLKRAINELADRLEQAQLATR
jgi:methyl-accepting chemotaxis protein